MSVEFGHNQYLGDLGRRIVEQLVSDELRWIFRATMIHDVGVDGILEIVDRHSRVTGKLISVQIKCGPSFFSERADGGVVFRGDREHLDLWLGGSLPVILVLCDDNTRAAYWIEISHRTIELTEKAWKVVVPFNQRLGSASAEALSRLTRRLQPQDYIRADLFRLVKEKFPDMIIASEFAVPEDYYWFPYLGRLQGEQINIGYLYLPKGRATVADVEQILRAKEINTSVCNTSKTKLFLIAHHVGDFVLDQDVQSLLASEPDVTTYRLVCSENCGALEEIDEKGQPILFYKQNDYLKSIRLEY